MLLPLQGVKTMAIRNRVSLRLPWAKRFWALLCIIGCTSTIQASLIVFGLHDNSARTC